MTSVTLVSVNVLLPELLGMHRGQPVESGIAKRPVTQDSLWLGPTNLEGDGQADLSVHGGPDKAVYAYPSEHLPVWSAELGQELGPAAFGENLTTAGATEDDVFIGDRWSWGDAVLEVCQPRSPCFKLAMHRGRGDIGRRFRESGRSGWYLRVLAEGRVPVAGPIEVVERHPMGATVRLVHEAARPGGAPAEVLEALLLVDPLADEWKMKLAARLWG
ncbi:MAG: MOSC domain-containing protein [Acidimicrobiales bacterium]